MDIYDLIGITGAVLVLFGLYRLTNGRWNNRSLWYELDHAIGSSLLVIYLLNARAYIGIVINAAYLVASIIGLSSYAERRTRHKKGRRR